MSEISLKELVANWKYAWAKAMQGKEKGLGQYTKLPYSLEELESTIKKELPTGGVLKVYAEINREWKEKFGTDLYDEIMYFYELCEGSAYFDISEIEELLYMEYTYEWNKQTFIQNCMNMIIKAPVKVQIKDKLYDVQYHLFRLGKEEEVWYAYQYKKLFPKEMLEKLYKRLKEEQVAKSRLAWITTWLKLRTKGDK